MSRVAVSHELIRWARERAGLTTRVLVEKFPKFELWERGEATPTLNQLELLAKRTHTPLGYFFLPTPPEERLPIPDFRTVKDAAVRRPSPDLLEVVQTMQRRQDWMREYLVEEGQPQLTFVGSARTEDSVDQVAAGIREALGIVDGWARHQRTWSDALREIRRLVEASGVMVVVNGIVGNNTHRGLDPDEFQGFVLCDPHAPLIFINGADFKSAQMFTIAHELAHLWLGKDGVFSLPDLQPVDNDIEKYCNQVAAEFLVPKRELKSCWKDAKDANEPFQWLALHFKVSQIVAARRALDLNLITRDQYFSFYKAYLNDERRKQTAQKSKKGGGDFYATQEVRLSRRFGEAVVRAALEGRLLYRDAYQLTGLHGQTFDRFADGLRGETH